ncbi:MAG: winged helix-turn-helix domain-containing protein [Candidatus Marinimicrobia bacterium]|nr:winged helix-turn-helix domain-containing protein [Candidatus Neomarinimicrobiota bacterium]
MIKNKKIDKYLLKIISSDEFSESKRYQELMNYLVKAALEDIIPKEITIAHDVFGKSFDDDTKNDTQVRVYIHNLRKKLDSYYQREGKNDEIIFEIPKGHYKVSFYDRKNKKTAFVQKSFLIVNLIFMVLMLTTTMIILSGNRTRTSDKLLTESPLWRDFIGNEEPVLIVIGDYYLYRLENLFGEQSHLYIRDYKINSDNDLEEFVAKKQPDSVSVKMTNHTLLGKMAPWTVSELTRIMTLCRQEFDLKLSSALQWQDLDKYNIIFIGTFKSLGILNELVSDRNFSYTIQPNTLNYHDLVSDSTFAYISTSSTIDKAYEDDFSAVVKLPISEHTSALIFSSTRDIGCIATVKHLTNPKTLIQFEKEHQLMAPQNRYFESIFKIQGFERNVNSVDLLHFDSISIVK